MKSNLYDKMLRKTKLIKVPHTQEGDIETCNLNRIFVSELSVLLRVYAWNRSFQTKNIANALQIELVFTQVAHK